MIALFRMQTLNTSTVEEILRANAKFSIDNMSTIH